MVLSSKKILLNKKEEKIVVQTAQQFIKAFPNKKTKTMKKYKVGLDDKIEKNITTALRKEYLPKLRTTVPDELTSILLEDLFSHKNKERNKTQKNYNDQKQTEMFIGNLLELYIQKEGLKFGWAFTATTVDKVDFVKEDNGSWTTLQIKNSDNTENSSSSTVRAGTTILKWARRNSKKGGYYWDKFPDDDLKKILSEDKFRKFISSLYK